MALLSYGSEYPLHPEGFDSLDDAWAWIQRHYGDNYSDIYVHDAMETNRLFFVCRKEKDETYIMCGTYWRKLYGYDDQN